MQTKSALRGLELSYAMLLTILPHTFSKPHAACHIRSTIILTITGKTFLLFYGLPIIDFDYLKTRL